MMSFCRHTLFNKLINNTFEDRNHRMLGEELLSRLFDIIVCSMYYWEVDRLVDITVCGYILVCMPVSIVMSSHLSRIGIGHIVRRPALNGTNILLFVTILHRIFTHLRIVLGINTVRTTV